jgi:hypothetical protein
MQRLVLMPNTIGPTYSKVGEFKPNEHRAYFAHLFTVGGTGINGGVIVASGTAAPAVHTCTMQVEISIHQVVGRVNPKDLTPQLAALAPPVFIEELLRLGNGESVHHAFPTMVRTVDLQPGSYICKIRSSYVLTVLGDDRWDVSLLY